MALHIHTSPGGCSPETISGRQHEQHTFSEDQTKYFQIVNILQQLMSMMIYTDSLLLLHITFTHR
jgi:hypothetical protein